MQEDCADHFNNQTWHLSECAENVTMCRKIVQEGKMVKADELFKM